ncbi:MULTISPECIES: 50S ribosomal protein L23 [Methylomonas]|uniref:50S ribosomal protein L23 n=1 Tax=Methylomonas TaxID=416 RepID=UPI001231ABAA|nr:50S ribosomal protein L23 [Methylomonas rhizoryzae]
MNNYKLRLATVLTAPVISEKSAVIAESNQYVFRVLKSATKLEIKNAVEAMFDVKVDAVRVLNVKGKVKRFGRSLGKRSDWKKAYIKLQSGYAIELASA